MTKKQEKIMFGDFSRYALFYHKSQREGIEGQYMIEDAQSIDILTQLPSIIFQSADEQKTLDFARNLGFKG